MVSVLGDNIDKLYKNYDILSDAKEKITEVSKLWSVLYAFVRRIDGAGKGYNYQIEYCLASAWNSGFALMMDYGIHCSADTLLMEKTSNTL